VIYDPVGGDVFDESVRCIAFDGRLLVIGFTSGRIPNVSVNMPLIKGFSVMGVRAGEYGRQFPEKGRENAEAVWRMADEGVISPHVHAELPLGALARGVRPAGRAAGGRQGGDPAGSLSDQHLPPTGRFATVFPPRGKRSRAFLRPPPPMGADRRRSRQVGQVPTSPWFDSC
jgi:hypothetical protein